MLKKRKIMNEINVVPYIDVMLVLLIIFIFGGEVIRGFMFALMVGVIVGTYSSLFIASPIMLDTITSKEDSSKK